MTDLKAQEVSDKLAIRECLSRYCRGLDRMDKAMAYAVFHPDATAHYYDIYQGSGHGFVDWVWESHAEMERHSHQVANVLIELDGECAASEAYVTVVLWPREDGSGKQVEIVCRGRYLDRWSKRDGEWAISERVHVLDTQTIHEITRGYVNKESRRDRNDASFKFIS